MAKKIPDRASKGLTSLLEQYWEAKEIADEATKELNDLKRDILEECGVDKKGLDEEEKAAFEKLSFRGDDYSRSKVSIYKTSRTSWDAEYLEKTLSKAQFRRAKKLSHSINLKITKGEKDED